MIDDILARLRQAADEFHLRKHATQDRADRYTMYQFAGPTAYRFHFSHGESRAYDPAHDSLTALATDNRRWTVNPNFVKCSPCTRPAAPERCGDCNRQNYWQQEV